MSLFVDSSIWFAAIVKRDSRNTRAKAILDGDANQLTTDHVLVETWLLLNSRFHYRGAELFWDRIRRSGVRLEGVLSTDLEAAWKISDFFPDQTFSIVDRTSFAVMERLGVNRVASFDDDFAIYRYGRGRDRAFEVLR